MDFLRRNINKTQRNGDIYISSNSTIKYAEIYSITGHKMIYTQVSGYETSLNCESLPSGLYIVNVKLSNGANIVNKFIK